MRSRILLHMRLCVSSCSHRSDEVAVDSFSSWLLLVLILHGSPLTPRLGSSDGRSAKSEEGLSRCPATDATSVTAAVRTKDIMTYDNSTI